METLAKTSVPWRKGWLVGLIMALSLIGSICYLAATYDTFPGDAYALRTLQSFQGPWLDDAALAASYLAVTPVAVVSILVLSLVLWLGRRKADAVVFLLVFLPEGINLGLKELVGRPRPDYSLLVSFPENPAFPSGHSVHALLIFGLLICVVGEFVRPIWLRSAIQGLLGLMILSVGASRVYLGVHWPSDVLGGYLLAGFSIVALLWIRKMLIYRGLQ